MFSSDNNLKRELDATRYFYCILSSTCFVGCCFRTPLSAPHTRPTQWLSRPPPIQKLGAENHILQLNIQCSWWCTYVPETYRTKNTSIKLPCCIKLAFQVISWGRCTVKQPSSFYQIIQQCENLNQENYSMRISIHLAAPIQSPFELTNLEII